MTPPDSDEGPRPRIGLTCGTMSEAEGGGVRRFQVPVAYVRRVEEAGGLPVLLPVSSPDHVGTYLPLVDGVLLIGGDDVDPALYGASPSKDLGEVDRPRDDFEIALVRAAADAGTPALGICRGLQVMNVAFGGTLHQHLPEEVPSAIDHRAKYGHAHEVEVVEGSRLSAVVAASRLSVNSHHHQAPARMASRLRVVARAGDGVVEAAEDPKVAFLVGVQWHPERLPDDDATRRLFRAFVDAAAAFSKKTRAPRAPSAGRASASGASSGRG